MKALETIRRTREYLDYVERHINNVKKAWEVVKDKCRDMRFIYDDFFYFTLNYEIENHDMSKLSEQEFIQYRKSFYPTEDEGKYDMSEAWDNHKRNNKHYWENWTEQEKKGLFIPNEWEIHCAHMVIDWMAMSYEFGDTPKEFYEKNKGNIKLPDYAVKFIYEIFDRVKEIT